MSTLEELLSDNLDPQVGEKVLIGGSIGRIVEISDRKYHVKLIFTNPKGGSISEIYQLTPNQIRGWIDDLDCWESTIEVINDFKR